MTMRKTASTEDGGLDPAHPAWAIAVASAALRRSRCARTAWPLVSVLRGRSMGTLMRAEPKRRPPDTPPYRDFSSPDALAAHVPAHRPHYPAQGPSEPSVITRSRRLSTQVCVDRYDRGICR